MSRLRAIVRTIAFAAVPAALALAVVPAFAQQNPPARFAGSVKVDGANAAQNTVIEARVGSTVCGTSTVFMNAGEARYSIDVDASSTKGGCGTEGATVTFTIGGAAAAQTGTWLNYQLNTLNLTSGAAPSGTGTPVSTPKPPDTGSGIESDSTTVLPLAGALAIAAVAGAAGLGLAVSRKR